MLRPAGRELAPVARLWVTLHRVGHDSAGPLDSVRTDARGRYRFSYAATGDERAIYFVSASFGDVAYFTPPLVAAVVRGEPAEIVVYDTTSRAVPLAVRGRHLIISAPGADANRSVLEVYELANDSMVTRVSPRAESAATWLGILPAGARAARAGEGDVPREAVSFVDSRVRVVAPMPPGVKQLTYAYQLPASAFPLSIPLGTAADLYEVLIEEPSGRASGARLAEVDPVTVDGRRFRRFLAQDVSPSAVALVDIPHVSRGWDPRFLVALTIVIGAAMMGTLALAIRRG